MTIEKTIFASEVRDYCIKNRLYTSGNNAEYEELLKMAENAKTDDDIIAVMRDIWNHSNTTAYKAEGGTFSSYAFDFMRECVNLFIVE